MYDLATKFSSFRVFSLNFEGDKLSPWLFFKGQFQLQCGIGAMVQPGSNPVWQMVKTHVIRLRGVEGRNTGNQIAFFAFHSFLVEIQTNAEYIHVTSAVASMRPTEALAAVKFWRISPIIFILHKRSSDIFNASWYYKEFSNSVNILWKNYHIIDLKGLRTLTRIFFEQILIKTIGEVNGHPDYVACFWLLLFKFHLNLLEKKLPKCPENAANRISERLKFKISRGGGGQCPWTPLATPACLGWPFGLATALVTHA